MAATFDTDLIHQVGEFLAEEAKLKSACVLLAPTCKCIHLITSFTPNESELCNGQVTSNEIHSVAEHSNPSLRIPTFPG